MTADKKNLETVQVTDESATEWTKAWKILVAALKELGVSDVDDTAKVILDRLAKENIVVVHRVSGSQGD